MDEGLAAPRTSPQPMRAWQPMASPQPVTSPQSIRAWQPMASPQPMTPPQSMQSPMPSPRSMDGGLATHDVAAAEGMAPDGVAEPPSTCGRTGAATPKAHGMGCADMMGSGDLMICHALIGCGGVMGCNDAMDCSMDCGGVMGAATPSAAILSGDVMGLRRRHGLQRRRRLRRRHGFHGLRRSDGLRWPHGPPRAWAAAPSWVAKTPRTAATSWAGPTPSAAATQSPHGFHGLRRPDGVR